MDKIDQLFDAIEHPERYSSEDIEAMLQDPEVKETFDLLDMTKSSLQPISIPNIDHEWEKFKNSQKKPISSHGFHLKDLLSRKIAAGIAIAVVSITAVAAIVGFGVNFLNSQKQDSPSTMANAGDDTDSSVAERITDLYDVQIVAPETIVFDNETFDTIIAKIAEYYDHSLEFSTDKCRELRLYFRWNQSLPIEEIVESLNNFEQIHLTLEDKKIKID